jgi:hypothetical protein
VVVQKGVGFSVVVEKMVMDVQATMEEVKHKLMKTNTKYKKVVDRHCHTKEFNVEDKVTLFLYKERFLVWSYNKL